MVYIFLANGFEECEALVPLDMLRRANIEVTTVSINKTTSVTGSHGITVTADRTAKNLIRDISTPPECIILPGGMPGSRHLDENETVDNMLLVASKLGAYIAAICAAPFILGRRGYLSGKNAVCYPGFEDQLIGAVLSDKGTVRDGNIITAKSAGFSFEFAYELIRALRGLDEADKVINAIYYKIDL